jgi:hypothetical protein
MSDSVPVGAVPDVWDNVGPSVPNSARMYDYYLGGKDNFPVDREAAEKAVAAMPAIPVLARANRAFLVDSVGKMAAAGVSQFLDIGSGLPTSPNVHEVARQTVPDARVVYVDYDPVVVLHSQAKRRVPGDVGAAFRRGHHRPAGGPVHGPARARQLPGAVACGHDGAVESELTGVQEAYEASPTDPAIRNTAAIRELFTGFEMLPPGLTDVRTFTDPTFAYSPEDPAPGIWMLCAAGRKL